MTKKKNHQWLVTLPRTSRTEPTIVQVVSPTRGGAFHKACRVAIKERRIINKPPFNSAVITKAPPLREHPVVEVLKSMKVKEAMDDAAVRQAEANAHFPHVVGPPSIDDQRGDGSPAVDILIDGQPIAEEDLANIIVREVETKIEEDGGTVVVSALGNDGSGPKFITYPRVADEVIDLTSSPKEDKGDK